MFPGKELQTVIEKNGVETGVLNEGVSLECELSIVTAKKNKKNVMNLYWCFELLICFVFL